MLTDTYEYRMGELSFTGRQLKKPKKQQKNPSIEQPTEKCKHRSHL